MTTELHEIIDRMESGLILTKKGDRYSPATLTNFRNATRWVMAFERNASGRRFFDNNYFQDLQIWLIFQNLSKNSVAITLQNIHAILRHEKAISLPRLEAAKSELTTAVYNTLEELRILSSLDLQEVPGYDRVRDAYILHCNVGLRFEDFQMVLKDINSYIVRDSGREYFKLKTGKAQEDVVIPVNRTAAQILAKRKYSFDDAFSGQYYNKAIKWVGRQAGFTQKIAKNITLGGRMTGKLYPKWQLMSSHTARRSFATNAWLEKVAEADIMKITGHRSTSAFRKYLRADALVKAVSLSDHPFFK